MFGMIRALQLIILSVLVRIPISGFAFEFFAGCMVFAQADIYDGSGLYSKWFTFYPSESLNSNYFLLGIETSNFLLNSGSFFIIAFQIIIIFLVKASANRVFKFCASSYTARYLAVKL